MRASSLAPAVRYPFGRSAAVGRVLAAVALSGLACLAAWLVWGTATRETMALKAAVGLALWCLCFAAAWRLWRAMPAGHLAWDGGRWELESHDPLQRQPLNASPQVHLDLQAWLLLQVRPVQGRPTWLWLEQQRSPGLWIAMRRALHARQGSGMTGDSPAHEMASGPTQTNT